MCPLERNIKVVRIIESHIRNDREYEFWLDIGLGFRDMWIGPSCPISNNIFFFSH